MLPLPLDLWLIDPMPVVIPPDVPRDSMAYYRWLSAALLAARQERG